MMFRFKKPIAAAVSLLAAALMIGSAGETLSGGSLPPMTAHASVIQQAKAISSCTVTVKTTKFAYNGKERVPQVIVMDGTTKLTRNTDYTLKYTNNKNPGKATVVVTGKGNYSGTASASFIITPGAIASASASSVTATSAKLTWSKTNGATGYKIYAYNKSKSRWEIKKTIASAATLSETLTGLTANTTYLYRVNAYISADGKSYIGGSKQVGFTTPKQSTGTTPVAVNGRLKVSGANIVNKNGQKFQIRGMSTHGLMWEDFSNITSTASLKTLRDDWGVNTIRLAMYTEEWGGYTKGYATQAKNKVNTGVANATSLGMYAVIDWHILNDGDPLKHKDEAVAFFTEMAQKYKNNENVIYEICNEPNGTGITWTNNVKPYATAVVSAIRKYDKNAIIIVGTTNWSQDIDKVVNSRLSDTNIVYSLHFYADTHKQWLRDRFTNCYNKGLPILVSEFGTCNAKGAGNVNTTETQTWLKLLDSKNVGYINWSACGKAETASAFKSGTNLSNIPAGESALTESGKLVRKWYRSRAGLK
ncbi:endoglucanase [Ruminococcus sp. YE71]|uniref:cellulase family glycosylhydrolase n=1 Tax=unclassified Ruminococcus TaxID=2608920 RepID=UPI00087EFB8D|nr:MULTISPECIES: cellulase family glycosylhydrolase [unclassified Ruminococcus]SDA13856.1 endoglucanase [Ruminococcus sp. YE78]SFW19979.1 endoglucanase [Ruminococcus sp. YE71]